MAADSETKNLCLEFLRRTMASDNEKTPLVNRERKVSYCASIASEKDEIEIEDDTVKLKKYIKLPATIGIIIGNVIGSGIFISPKGVAENAGSVGATLIVWASIGIYVLAQAMCYAELGTMIPKAGGDYSYVYYILGPLPAFLCMWMHVTMICTSSNAAIARTAALYLVQPLALDCNTTIITLMAVWIIVTFAVINIASTRLGVHVQNIFSLAKVGALIVIIVIGIVQLAKGSTQNFQDPFAGTKTDPGLITVAFVEGYFAYKGWELVNTLPEEMVNPKRDLPRGIGIGVIAITLIYVLTNVAYFSVLSVPQMLKSEAVALTFAELTIPGAGPWIISIFVAISCMGTINGSFLSDTRYLFAGGRFNQMPRMYCMLSFKFLTPVLSIITVGIISIIYTFIPDISQLVEMASLAVQLKIFLCLSSLVYLRWTRPDLKRPIKPPIVLIIFVMFILLALVGLTFYSTPLTAGLSIGLFIIGIPVFYLTDYLKDTETANNIVDKITVFMQSIFHIVPESRRKRNYTLRIDDMFPRTSND